MRERKKVVFIAGFGRSGTTLLGNLLGQLDGWFCAGEPGYLLERRILDNSVCSCRQPIGSCQVWRHVVADYADLTEQDVQRAIQKRSWFKNRHCWYQLTSGGKQYIRNMTAPMSAQFARLFFRLTEATGNHVIVDTSKMPSHGYLLQQIEGIDLYVVHVIRDPRAVAFSWQKKNKVYDVLDGKARHFPQIGPGQCTFAWLWWNITIEFLWGRGKNYQRVRYEDLMEDPKNTLMKIVSMVGEQKKLEFFENDHTVNLDGLHVFAGNPARFCSGKKTVMFSRVGPAETG